MPRILMATLLGLTISAPLETVIFNTEIMRTWEESKGPRIQSKSFEAEQLFSKNIEMSKKSYEEAKEKYNKSLETYNNALKGVGDEVSTGKGGPRGYGSEAKKLQEIADKYKIQLDNDSKKVEAERIKLDKYITSRDSTINDYKNKVINEKPGFLDKLLMLEKLSSHDKLIDKYNPKTKSLIPDPNNPNENKKEVVWGAAFWPIWLVRLLFIIVEVAPVLLKLMLIKGPYDYMTENVHQILETKQGISIFHMIDEHSQLHKLKRNHNPERIIGIIEHQNVKEEENSKIAIDQLAEVEKRKIIDNPDDFFQKNS
jgi:hypothetical protein